MSFKQGPQGGLRTRKRLLRRSPGAYPLFCSSGSLRSASLPRQNGASAPHSQALRWGWPCWLGIATARALSQNHSAGAEHDIGRICRRLTEEAPLQGARAAARRRSALLRVRRPHALLLEGGRMSSSLQLKHFVLKGEAIKLFRKYCRTARRLPSRCHSTSPQSGSKSSLSRDH